MKHPEMGDKLMNAVMKWAVRTEQMIVGLMTGQLGSQIKSRLEYDITRGFGLSAPQPKTHHKTQILAQTRSCLLKSKWN